MKTMSKIFAVGLAVLAAAACRPSGGKDLQTETVNYEDSTAHADLSIQVELPVAGQGAAADRIRASLVDVMDGQLSHIGSYEEERLFPPYEGSTDKTDLLLEYYRDKALESIGKLSQEDYDERVASIEENDGLTEGQRKEILDEMPGWEYEFNLLKSRETDQYVVFLSQDYVYLGGAHGGVTGRGGLTFGKKDGVLLDKMLDPACLDAIQPLLRKGLRSISPMRTWRSPRKSWTITSSWRPVSSLSRPGPRILPRRGSCSLTSSMRSRPTRPACPNSRFPTPTSSRT